MIRIAQLTKYGELAASTRQRFDQYHPYLAALNCETESWPLFDNECLRDLYSGRRRSLGYVLSRYARRARKLINAKEIDLLWIHKEVFPYLPGFVDLLIRSSRKPIVFDYDDAIFHNYDLNDSTLVRLAFGGKLSTILSVAEVAFCGNNYLYEYAQRYCQRVKIVPTVLDTSVAVPVTAPLERDHTRVGWIGTPSTWTEYMAPMMPLLAHVAAECGARIMAVGAECAVAPHPLLDSLCWSEKTEVVRIQEMDIGIMPLTDTPWARGKCGYKLIQYMACGLPVVASPVGVNAEIVEHGVNGFLASTELEWRGALDRLIGDPDLRRRMGMEGRRKVEAKYSLKVWGPRVAEILERVARTGRA